MRPAVSNRGFTLVELIITMTVVTVAVLGISYALSFAFSHQSDGLWQARAVALGEAYIEEIMARRFDETTPLGGVPPCSPTTVACTGPGPEGETRAQFDDVDDYHGVADAPPVDADGNVRADYAGYRVDVTVAYATPAQVASFGLDANTDAKVVTVTVTPPAGGPMAFNVVRGNY